MITPTGLSIARIGEKVLVATPGATQSNDDAIASGYRVIDGSELSSREWTAIKAHDAIQSTAEVFPHATVSSTTKIALADPGFFNV